MNKRQYPGCVMPKNCWNLSFYEYHQFHEYSPDSQGIDAQLLSSALSDRIKPGEFRVCSKEIGISPTTLSRMAHGKLPYNVTVVHGKPQKQLDLETVHKVLRWLFL